MEIQNLRLQLLHIADGNVEAAKQMENYVTGVADAELNLGEAPKAEAGEEEYRCPLCVIGRLIEKDPNKTLISISK
ncbi:hypothetical protein [Acinetobacter bouvetii]|nr:hypothetical protein [Acinetobacter bouvetii]